MTITDPRLARETTRVPRRSDYVKRPVLIGHNSPRLKAHPCGHVKAYRHEC